ncbi:MAG: hypothetical protein Q7Q71_01180 [Verrucomicrobiota bacterium JB023]|nr:hypothetical protein [Verrucomicrobiota bacterium JB023]
MMRTVNAVARDTRMKFVLGRPDDLQGTANAIREVLGTLKMDDAPESPHNRDLPQ